MRRVNKIRLPTTKVIAWKPAFILLRVCMDRTYARHVYTRRPILNYSGRIGKNSPS